MSIQTFRAASIQEALQLVRSSLGPDASVLNTRLIRRGLFTKPQVEVQASCELSVPSRFGNPAISEDHPLRNSTSLQQVESIARVSTKRTTSINRAHFQTAAGSKTLGETLDSDEGESIPSMTAPIPRAPTPSVRRSSLDIFPGSDISTAEIHSSASTFQDVPRSVEEVVAELSSVGVPALLARQLLESACQRCDESFHNDAWLIRGQIIESAMRRLSVAATAQVTNNEQRVLAFVGPTGAGKTTLLGKIASQAHHENQLEIGIIAVDSWRSGAAEQLLSLADTLSAEVQAVSMTQRIAEQFTLALQRLRECDLVLVDTAGVSPNDHHQMRGLSQMLNIAQPHEVHLVLGVNTAPTYVQVAIDQFARLGATNLDIAKVDEAVGIGQWLAPLFDYSIPISFLSHGQELTNDLVQPNPRRLASILLGQYKLTASSPQNGIDSVESAIS